MTGAYATTFPVDDGLTFDRERYGNTAEPDGVGNPMDDLDLTTPGSGGGEHDNSYYAVDPSANEGGGIKDKLVNTAMTVGSVCLMAPVSRMGRTLYSQWGKVGGMQLLKNAGKAFMDGRILGKVRGFLTRGKLLSLLGKFSWAKKLLRVIPFPQVRIALAVVSVVTLAAALFKGPLSSLWHKFRGQEDLHAVDAPPTPPCEFLPLWGDDSDEAIKEQDANLVAVNDAVFAFDPARVGPNRERPAGDQIKQAYTKTDDVSREVQDLGKTYGATVEELGSLMRSYSSEPKIQELYAGSEKTLKKLSDAPAQAMTPMVSALASAGEAHNAAYGSFVGVINSTREELVNSHSGMWGKDKLNADKMGSLEDMKSGFNQGLDAANKSLRKAEEWMSDIPSGHQYGTDDSWRMPSTPSDQEQETPERQHPVGPGWDNGYTPAPPRQAPTMPATPAPAPDTSPDRPRGTDTEDSSPNKDKNNSRSDRPMTEGEVNRLIDEAGKIRGDLSHFGDRAFDTGQQFMESPSNPFSPNSPFNPANPSNPFNPSNPNGLFSKLQQGLTGNQSGFGGPGLGGGLGGPGRGLGDGFGIGGAGKGLGGLGAPGAGTTKLSDDVRSRLEDADKRIKEAEEKLAEEREAAADKVEEPLAGEEDTKDDPAGEDEAPKGPLDDTGDPADGEDAEKDGVPSLTGEDETAEDIDPNSTADNPEEGTPDVSSDPNAPGAEQSTKIARGGTTFEMDSPQAARTAELISPEDGSAPKTLRDAAAEAGFSVPADGPIGESVSPNNMRPGDFVIGGGEEGVYLGDGKVLTVNGVTPLDEIAQFDGVGEGVYRPSLADGVDAVNPADIPPMEDIPPAPEESVNDAPPPTADAADVAAPPEPADDSAGEREWKGFTTESLFEGEDVEQKLAAPRGDSGSSTQAASGHPGSLGSIPVAD